MEYATREDAQTAIDTMSNTQLMGRLVYVREVSGTRRSRGGGGSGVLMDGVRCRIVRLSLASLAVPADGAVGLEASAAVVAVSKVAFKVAWAAVAVATAAVAPRSTCPT